MKRVDDVIIIGAGIIGLLCAYYLSKEKFKVTVLEKKFPGSGDTTKTGGGIRYLHGSAVNISFSKMSHSFWTYYKAKSHKRFFENTGHLFLTSKPENLETFRQQAELLLIGFYALYVMWWAWGRLKGLSGAEAYMAIPFEREAYDNDINLEYLESRKRFSWINYIRKT